MLLKPFLYRLGRTSPRHPFNSRVYENLQVDDSYTRQLSDFIWNLFHPIRTSAVKFPRWPGRPRAMALYSTIRPGMALNQPFTGGAAPTAPRA